MLSRANFLIFDEPTNHLDVESIEALEDAIEAYEGTVLLVSHDRALLRALATRVWVLHNRRITDFPGSFPEWEEVSRERAHAARVQAQEEESLRRMHEKQRLERQSSNGDRGRPDQRQARRDAARRLERAEREAERWESRVAELTRALEDPALYMQPDAKRKAAAMGKELDAAKKALDAALAEWAEAEQA
jgi:ATP-binding cassette subfamily F protein 3